MNGFDPALPALLAAAVSRRIGDLVPIAAGVAFDEAWGELRELAEPEACAERRARFRPGLEDREFRERGIAPELGPGTAGIRFRNLDPSRPFVELTLGFTPTSAELARLAEYCRREFAVFSPHEMTFHERPGWAPGVTHETRRLVLWGATADAPEVAAPEAELRWEAAADACFDEYSRAYAETLAREPWRRGYYRAESREDLDETARDGRLLSLYVDGAWAGLVSGQERAFYGIPALYMFEIFIAERARGRGLARAMQSAFLRKLAPRYPWVFGTIWAKNLPSLKTAQAMGRKVVETEYVFSLL